MERLLYDTGSSRTTLRLFDPDADYPVAAEAVAAGVPTIGHNTTVPQASADTARWIAEHGVPLVVDDVSRAELKPPRAMIDVYGLSAFILAPLRELESGALAGWISVHVAGGPRRWRDADLAAVARAVERVECTLDPAAWLTTAERGASLGPTDIPSGQKS